MLHTTPGQSIQKRSIPGIAQTTTGQLLNNITNL